MQMNCANLQLAHLTDADNQISPEEHVALRTWVFSVAESHRRDTKT